MFELQEQRYPSGDPCDPFTDEPYTEYSVIQRTKFGIVVWYKTRDKIRAEKALKVFGEGASEKK